MKTIALVSQKGGSGKSMAAVNLASIAGQKSRVVLIDMDPQQTSLSWYQRRDADEPKATTATAADLEAKLERAKGQFDFVFIDTAGARDPSSAAAVRAADFCLIPTSNSPFDLQTVNQTADQCRQTNKPFAFLLSRTPPIGGRGNETSEALKALGTVAPIALSRRVAYEDAAGLGQAAFEYEPEGKAASEIADLWNWLQGHIEKVGFDL